MPRVLLAALGLASLACGSSPPPPTTTATPSEVATEEPPAPPRQEGTIAREELDAVLEAGLGRFLQGVETEPHLANGAFVGFRLTALRAPLFDGLDLQEGDTLVSVNGLPIERPEQALTVWNGLRVASELTLEYLRAGEAHQLRFAIEDGAR